MDSNFKRKCDQYEIIYSNESEIREFHSLLTYPDEVINAFLRKLNPNSDIKLLIKCLEEVKSREASLSQLTNGETEKDLLKSIFLIGIERCIRSQFPDWSYEESRDLPSDLILEYSANLFMRKSPRIYCSKYSQAAEEYKESLNESLRSGNLFLGRLLFDLNTTFLKLISSVDLPERIVNKIVIIIKSLDSQTKIIELTRALEILIEWRVDILFSPCFEIIMQSTEQDVRQNIHGLVLSEFFRGTYEKGFNQLLRELRENNSEDDIDGLKFEYDEVMKALDEGSLDDKSAIRSWDADRINSWSASFTMRRIVKSFADDPISEVTQLLLTTLAAAFPSTSEPYDSVSAERFSNRVTSVSKYERLAVIIRAVEVETGIKLRAVQIASLLLLLDAKKDRGRLAQIGTGEGKTIIIAALAAYHALDGRRVDVITSSELLVYPQLDKLKGFYEVLGLKVSHNFGPSGAYLLDIVYGTSSKFQGDILRDEFRKLGTRHKRKCDVAIIDEVDNMLIDGNDNVVYLSCPMPGMDHLETLLAVISIQVKVAAGALRQDGDRIYLVQSDNAIDERGEIMDEISENWIEIDVPPYEFIRRATDSHLRKLIRDCDEEALGEFGLDYPEIRVPKHLRKLITDVQLEKWIRKAIQAKVSYVNKEDYILDKDQVKIVDADNTGVVQKNMQWSDGLHQFIQIKHGACLTPESLTTNFISNVSFFRRYKPHIYGLTGTLGCQWTRGFLKRTYRVDDVIIPPFKLKQHRELKAIIVEDKEDWLREIVKNSLEKVINDRPVLIIMEYIRQIEAIEKIFDEFSFRRDHIKLCKTDGDSGVIEESLNHGEILITTNIAGRGADIKVHSGVDAVGGLHVCLTFLPKNSRVEVQNIGRTSRTGNLGTSQFILNSKEDIETLREKRDRKEAATLAEAAEKIEQVTMKDEIFHEFCELTDDIDGRNEFVRETERKAVEERFAIWLKMNEKKITRGNRATVFRSFKAFRDEILEDEMREKLVKNPYMYVETGNKYLEKKDYINAIKEYTLAIRLDRYFSEHAYFNRACACIAQYGNDLLENERQIDAAILDFQKSRELIEEKEHNLHLMQNASENQVYSRQISNKLNLYNFQKSAIEVAIGPDWEAIDRSLEDLLKRRSQIEKYSDDWTKITDVIEDLMERRENFGVIQEARVNERELRINFIEWKKCLPIDDDSHAKEIEEFERNGAIGSFTISELPPVDWVSVIGLLLLGFGQLIAGAALAVFTIGAGATFGAALMAEGISDIIAAVKDGIINRDFSWERWAIEKAISLTISVVFVGWAAMRDVAQAVRGGLSMTAQLGRVALPQAIRTGWKIVARKVAADLSKAATKEFAQGLANYGLAETLLPWLRCRIMEIIHEPIARALRANRNLKMMLKLDKVANNSAYEDRIRTIGLELLKARGSSTFVDLGKRMGGRVIDHLSPKTTTYRKLYDLKAKAEEALVRLPYLTYKFVRDFTEAIDEMADDENVEERYDNRGESEARADASSGSGSKEPTSEADFGRFGDEEEQVKPQHSGSGVRRIAKNYSDAIAKTIVDVVQKDYVAPVVQMGVGYTVDKALKNETEALDEYIETYRTRRRRRRSRDEDGE